ncbi:hypothetical protein Tco_1459604 [Tanacetum coccineum]
MMTYHPSRLEGLPFELERDLLPIIPRNLRIVSSGVKSSLRWLPVKGIRHLKTHTLRGYTRLGSQAFTLRTLRSPSKPDRVHICMISGAIRGY